MKRRNLVRVGMATAILLGVSLWVEPAPAQQAFFRDRLMAGLTAMRALLHQLRPSTWRMADSRGQERDPLSELARRLPLPPMSF